MQFVSLEFLIFILSACLITCIIPQKYRYIWFLAASWGFYYKLNGKFLILLVIVTVVAYVAGRAVGGENGDRSKKKAVLVSSITILVLMLGYFKYTGFLMDTVRSIQSFFKLSETAPVLNIILPAGISFYLFQAIGYIADCYMGKIEPENNYLRLATFISFFPQISAGPIERASNMLPQYMSPKKVSMDDIKDAALLILWGYFQKIIIADRLVTVVNSVYANYEQKDGGVLFLATLCYTLQIYCDFAGYSNIAIGTAKLMGIKLMDNFKNPYLSESVAEFWRRWHISLSTWFRDYIYIPLGGNRKGLTRKLINLMIVFAVSGLWHGAAWTFVVWGLIHGLFQVAGILLKPLRDKLVDVFNIDRESFSHKFVKIFVTFMLVNIGRVFFRAESFAQAAFILKNMWKISPWIITDGTLISLGLSAPDVYLLIGSLIVLFIVDVCNYRGIIVRENINKQGLWMRWVIYIVAAVFVITCGVWGPGYDASSFIYSSF